MKTPPLLSSRPFTTPISSENMLWISDCCLALDVKPEAFINTILTLFKSESGILDQPLSQWINQTHKNKENLEIALRDLEDVRILIEETTRATRLYINQINHSSPTAIEKSLS